MYHLYCSPDGVLLDDNLNIINTYITKSQNGRKYIAFNHLNHQRIYLHRIVAFLFVEGYRKDLVVDHIDNNSLNNYPINLQYLIQRDNITKECGERTVVLNIYNHHQLFFNSKADLFKYFNVSSTSINMMIKRYHELNVDLQTFLNIYSHELDDLYEKYIEEDNQKAASTIKNMQKMISEGWIVQKYKYKLHI